MLTGFCLLYFVAWTILGQRIYLALHLISLQYKELDKEVNDGV